MVVIIKIVQVILSLSLLVVVHEFGHFIFAKLFKIRVEKFYLFFPPAIFKYKPKNNDTEFGIGCIPLGGFCKISGMIDESMDKETMAQEPQPWEFRTKPAWQRLLVMVGGVLFNFILAMIIYSGVLLAWGEKTLKNEDVRCGIEVNDLAYEVGFRNGDRIIAFDETPTDNFAELQIDLVRLQAKTAKVVRGQDTLVLDIDQQYLPAILNTPGMFTPYIRVQIASVPDTSINRTSDLRQGDTFLAIGTDPVRSIREVQSGLKGCRGDSAEVTFLREGEEITRRLALNEDRKMEVLLQGDASDLKFTSKEYSLASCIPAGISKTFSTVSNYFKELKLIFSPQTEAYKSVGSFIAIGSIFPSRWNWEIFWNLTAWLSVMLAVLNILPIPALDGGHIVFTLYEIITGRKPSDKFLEYAQMVGMLILFALIILAFGNDIYRLFK